MTFGLLSFFHELSVVKQDLPTLPEMLVVFVFFIFSNYLFSLSLLCVVRSATISAEKWDGRFVFTSGWFVSGSLINCCLTSSGRYFMHIPEWGKWLIFYRHFFYLFMHTIVKNDYHIRWCSCRLIVPRLMTLVDQ